MSNERILDVALRLAEEGLPVFPCVPGAKRPLTPHGLYDATRDPDLIRAWWTRRPTANLAIPTGAATFDVLDVDVRPTGSGYTAFNELVRARLVTGFSHVVGTPSGGIHAYFTGTDQSCARLPGQHLDFKATGGYVLAPPSVVNGRPYELIRRGRTRITPLDWDAVRSHLTPPTQQVVSSWRVMEAGIEPLAAWVARLPEGQRNSGTFWAACRAVEQGHTDLTPIIDAAVSAGLPQVEAARTVASALKTATARPRPAPLRTARTSTRSRTGS